MPRFRNETYPALSNSTRYAPYSFDGIAGNARGSREGQQCVQQPTPNASPSSLHAALPGTLNFASASSLDITTIPSIPRSTPPKRKHAARRNAEGPHIPRPRNAFILYRTHTLNQGTIDTTQQNQASVIIAKRWKSESPQVRERFEELAREEKKKHAQLYPDYKYAPGVKKSTPDKKVTEVTKAGGCCAKQARRRRAADGDDDEDWAYSRKSSKIKQPQQSILPTPDPSPEPEALLESLSLHLPEEPSSTTSQQTITTEDLSAMNTLFSNYFDPLKRMLDDLELHTEHQIPNFSFSEFDIPTSNAQTPLCLASSAFPTFDSTFNLEPCAIDVPFPEVMGGLEAVPTNQMLVPAPFMWFNERGEIYEDLQMGSGYQNHYPFNGAGLNYFEGFFSF